MSAPRWRRRKLTLGRLERRRGADAVRVSATRAVLAAAGDDHARADAQALVAAVLQAHEVPVRGAPAAGEAGQRRGAARPVAGAAALREALVAAEAATLPAAGGEDVLEAGRAGPVARGDLRRLVPVGVALGDEPGVIAAIVARVGIGP